MWTLSSLNCWSLSLRTKRTGSKSFLASWRSGFSAWPWGCWPPALATPLRSWPISWRNSSTIVKPKKILDIKEAQSVDVEQERKRLKRSNIALGGAAFASLAVAVVVAVVTVLLFLLILGAIIGFFTSL